MEIRPIETFIYEGIEHQFAKVFGCQAKVTTAYEKLRLLARTQGGNRLTYPYAFLSAGNFRLAPDRYVAKALSREGVIFRINNGDTSAYAVRLLAADFPIQVDYRSESADPRNPQSVIAFSRRMMFAQRGGLLSFQITFGSLVLPISVGIEDVATYEDRPTSVENSPEYKASASLIVRGWVSEPITKLVGIVQQVQLDGEIWNYEE